MLGLEFEAFGDGAQEHLGDLDPVLVGWFGLVWCALFSCAGWRETTWLLDSTRLDSTG